MNNLQNCQNSKHYASLEWGNGAILQVSGQLLLISDAPKWKFWAETENLGCTWPKTETEAENGFF